MIGLPEDDGWEEQGWVQALDAGRPPESGSGGGGRGGRGGRGARDSGDGRDEKKDEDYADHPEDRPWTPIPRQAKSPERGLIPPQRRLKKTSRSA